MAPLFVLTTLGNPASMILARQQRCRDVVPARVQRRFFWDESWAPSEESAAS